MSNLSNEVPVPKEAINDENSTSSRVMIFTLLLLIAGLLMSGTMMLYYTNAHRGGRAPAITKAEVPTQTHPPMSSFFEKMKHKTPVSDSDNSKINANSGVMGQLFSGHASSSVNWPKLKLTGFGSATDRSSGFAIINNHQYHQGDLINGKVKLIEIRKHDILIEYEGETNTLSMKVSD